MFGWFDAKDAEAFGNQLAEIYDRKCQEIEGAAERKRAVRQEKQFVELLMLTAGYKKEKAPNIYQKARLANSFKWKLRDMGYDGSLIDALTKEVLLALN